MLSYQVVLQTIFSCLLALGDFAITRERGVVAFDLLE